MFNTTNNRHTNNLNLNTPATGIIQKSHIKSFFKRMHQESPLADIVFDNKGYLTSNSYEQNKDNEVVVLQVLLTHENWFLVELIYKKDLME